MQGYARILESYRSSLQSEVQVRRRSVPSGYSKHLETREENRSLAQRHTFARWRNNPIFDWVSWCSILRYARVASDLPTSCDGCGESKKFEVNHALDCKKGGLVTARHDEICDELRDLLHMCLVHPISDAKLWLILSRCVQMVPKRVCQVLPPRPTFWMLIAVIYWFAALGRDRLILLLMFEVANLDSESYKNLPPKKALERQKKEKKKKNCKPCENQRRHFTPFVVSTDGMYGFEAPVFLKRLAKLLAEEWEKSYPTVRGFINARMSIALVRATNRCIRGSRIPVSNMSTRFRWEGGAGLWLLRSDNY